MFEQQAVSSAAMAAVAQLRAAWEALLACDLSVLPDDELLNVLTEFDTQSRRTAAVDVAIVAEIDQRGLAGRCGCTSTAALLSTMLLVDPGRAARRVRDAQEFGPRRAVTGAALEPEFADAAQGLADGSISIEQARVVSDTVHAIPLNLRAGKSGDVESFLVAQAHQFEPRTLRGLGKQLIDTIDPDGTAPREAEQARRRHLTVRQRPDGSSSGSFELTPLATEALLTVLDPLAKPKPSNADGDGASGPRDDRSAGQRRHDALEDAMRRLLASGTLPDCGGITTTMLITMTAEQAATAAGYARTGHGARIPTRLALTLAGDAQIQVVITGINGIEAYSSSRRLFTRKQRLAMAARDGGCTVPGCTAPPAWCQAHHIIEHADGGPTSVANGTLVCGDHHRNLDTNGWRCVMINGVPHWIPPPWIDPLQRPRRNRGAHVSLEEWLGTGDAAPACAP